jgi:hypothetical protein
LPDQVGGGAEDQIGPPDELVRRQHGAGLLVEPEELDDMPEVLSEDPFIATGQDRHRTRTNASQLCQAGGIFKNVDRLELDRTDREKLFEFQTTRSTRLPERFQRHGIGHWELLF